MSLATLRETLEQLHHELASAGPIDPELREDLERALEELRQAVESEGHEEETDSGLSETISELALRFETDHPLLTEALGRIVRSLSRMGI